MIPGAEWSICPGEPGEESPRGGWIMAGGPQTIAAALRNACAWTLDHPARDFDEETWWVRARFDKPRDAAVLGLDGIATLADVQLNGEGLLHSENMFVAHRCDVSPLLRPRSNELLIRCDALGPALKARRARPRWRTPMVRQQQLRWWRTTLLGRTPGWSPPAAPVGVWREAWLSDVHEAAVRDLRISAVLDGDAGVVRWHPAGDLAGELVLRGHGGEWRAHLQLGNAIRIPSPELWWPHTHGKAAVYECSVHLADGRSFALPPVGFRRIEVESSAGGFRVLVNSEPVFCRGAVWMPLDPVSLRASDVDYAGSIEQVRRAGMNMLRVPGTAVYEEDAFYEACDRAGILIWQDFMFANMDYPASDAAFAASVEKEVTQQAWRLAAHPCVAVLCGNSEAEQQAAMWGAPRESWEQPLFTQTIARLCEEIAPHVAYWPSSAHGGALPQQPDTGTTSYYGVGAYLRPLEDARTSSLKFATECLAFANVPQASTIARMPGGESLRPHHPSWKERTPRDLGAGWDFEDVRDHYLELLFHTDARRLRSTDPQRYLALSRITSAELMAAAFDEWRRPASSCSGALVLMLRDLWPGAGWGLLDDQGKPKACWHALARALQPVSVSITDEGLNGLAFHILNETAQSVAGTLLLRAWQPGGALVAKAEQAIELGPRTARTIAAASLLDHFLDMNWSHRFGPPPCEAVELALLGDDGAAISRAHFVPDRPALAAGRDIGLQARVVRRDTVAAEIAVTSSQFAFGVHFEVHGMTADQEYFHLAPGDEAVVTLRGANTVPSRGWVHALNALAPVAIEELR